MNVFTYLYHPSCLKNCVCAFVLANPTCKLFVGKLGDAQLVLGEGVLHFEKGNTYYGKEMAWRRPFQFGYNNGIKRGAEHYQGCF